MIVTLQKLYTADMVREIKYKQKYLAADKQPGILVFIIHA